MPSKLYTHNLEFSKWMLIQDTSYSSIDLISTSQPNLSKKSGVHPSIYSNLHHDVSCANFNLCVFLSSLLLDWSVTYKDKKRNLPYVLHIN